MTPTLTAGETWTTDTDDRVITYQCVSQKPACAIVQARWTQGGGNSNSNSNSNSMNVQVMAFTASLLKSKFANGQRLVDMSVQLVAFGWQVALPAFYPFGYQLLGTDEWKSLCNLLPLGGKLHLPHTTINGRSHLKQFAKTLIQAIPIEFPNPSNAIRQKVRLGTQMIAAKGFNFFEKDKEGKPTKHEDGTPKQRWLPEKRKGNVKQKTLRLLFVVVSLCVCALFQRVSPEEFASADC